MASPITRGDCSVCATSLSASARSSRPAPQRRAFVTAGLACDVGDGAAGAIALYRGDFQRSSAGAPVTVPVLAVVLGAWVLRGLGR